MNLIDIYDCQVPKKAPVHKYTGVLGIDILLGGGWLPGKLVEISGTIASGKTTLAWCSLGAAQARGGLVATISGEVNTTEDWLLQRCGVDLQKLVVLETPVFDDALDMCEDLLSHAKFDTIVLDNLQRSAVKSGKARVSKERANRLSSLCQHTGTTIILVTDTTMHWLDAHQFWIAQHIHTTYRGQSMLGVHTVRTPDGYVNMTLDVPVRKDGGIDYASHLLRLAVKLQLVEDKHGHFSYRGNRIGHGHTHAANWLAQATDERAHIEQAIRADAGRVLFSQKAVHGEAAEDV